MGAALRSFIFGILFSPALRRILRCVCRSRTPRTPPSAVPPLESPLPPRYESMEPALWLSRAVAQLWSSSHVSLADLILNELLVPLLAHKPPTLRHVQISRLALGSNSPSIHNVKAWRGRRAAVVIIDFDVDWVTSGFELAVGFGKTFPLVRATDLVYRGKMRVELHGMKDTVFAIEKCGVSAVEKPIMEFSIEAAGSVDVMAVPKVSEWLTGFLEKSVCEAILWPKQCVFHDLTRPPDTGPQQLPDQHQSSEEGGEDPPTPQLTEWTNKVMVGKLDDGAPGAGFPPGTVGLLQIRLCEAAQLGKGDSAAKILQESDSVVNPYVAFKLGKTMKSSRRWRRTNAPSFEEMFEIPVKEPLTDLLEIKMYHEAEQVVDKVHALFKDKLLGSTWISVEEVAKEQGWVDLWVPLKSGQMLPGDDIGCGYLRLQLTYDVIHDPHDLQADEKLRQSFNQSELRVAAPQSPISAKSSRRTAGVWQLHLLEGSQWKKENVSQLVSDSRCDIKCAGKTIRSTPCYDTKHPSWGEYFEFPVEDPLADIVTISGVDEDPFAKEAYLGRALLALSAVGDVVPQEFWIQLRKRSDAGDKKSSGQNSTSGSSNGGYYSISRGEVRIRGWIRIWAGFKSYIQEYPQGSSSFSISNAEILINPSLVDLRARNQSSDGCAGEQRQLNIAPWHRQEEQSITQSALLKSLEGLNPAYLVKLAERLPRSLMKYGHHVLWDKVIKNVIPPVASDTANSTSLKTIGRVDSAVSLQSEVQSYSSLESELFSTSTNGLPEHFDLVPRPGSSLLCNENSQVVVVTFVTGDRFRAGTKAKVWVEFRRKNERHAVVVDRDRDNFARGASDRILMEIPKSIGKPASVVVGHDNGGLSPSWFLEEVTVSSACPERPANAWSVSFPCHRWIGLSENHQGDHRSCLRVHLHPT